jgi:hypothetical protein
MPEEKIPFDFGPVRGNLNCRIHGDQIGGFVIRVDSYADKPPVQTVFCAHCLLDAIASMVHPMRTIRDRTP